MIGIAAASTAKKIVAQLSTTSGPGSPGYGRNFCAGESASPSKSPVLLDQLGPFYARARTSASEK